MQDKTIDYLDLLIHSYDAQCQTVENTSRLEYLSENIFGFETYDSDMSEFFARKAVEVCVAINENKTFDYQHKTENNYMWYLIMCNMPFFKDKLEWGTSIRGAWWNLYDDKVYEINSCGLYENYEQILSIKFNKDEWHRFIIAISEFASNKQYRGTAA